jgi:hypothetical protein
MGLGQDRQETALKAPLDAPEGKGGFDPKKSIFATPIKQNTKCNVLTIRHRFDD